MSPRILRSPESRRLRRAAMTTLALASVKGSPGVTTTALALASWWPRPVVIVEADPAGGDLAARLGLPEEPGLVGLAASLRRNSPARTPDAASIENYLQAAPVQTTSEPAKVLTAPAGGRQATAVLSLLSEHRSLPMPGGADLLVDLGRRVVPTDPVDQSTPLPLMDPSDRIIWISRPQLADLAHLAAEVDHRKRTDPAPLVILNGSGPYPAGGSCRHPRGGRPRDTPGRSLGCGGAVGRWRPGVGPQRPRAGRPRPGRRPRRTGGGGTGQRHRREDAAAPGDRPPGGTVRPDQRIETAASGSHS